MKQYDKDGDYMDPATRLAGLLVTEENAASRKRIIAIPFEISRIIKSIGRYSRISNLDCAK